MTYKVFAERLHQELDQIGFPIRMDERVEAFSKLMDIPRFKAESLLGGTLVPEPELLQRLADELEVSEAWLSGESTER